ncbi:NarL family two-component system sensor histidine kinase LiaS [Paenibacillus shirakamiensis]|uniref:Sensor histidine kinase n=1 Tax=Paenibacillus shirakamiensis TaxID=1265935 RepID=A0ABS4JLQ2_9BACL|nr:histidine kinase [Paenibacillus shirakamiensis]MBP2002021.1 NarL family two-component system sensor histidine kinase LiaS [Paenibacillus shirakamiensis]
MRKKKPVNMISRGMRDGILLSFFLCAAILYILITYHYLTPSASWTRVLPATITLLLMLIGVGAGYGIYQVYRIKKRLDILTDSLLQWEKGNLSGAVPQLGEDEVGRLSEQLTRIGKRWEEQVNSLQRLSTHNAQLAEQARVSAIIEERQRLARELHDAVSQQLFAISMTATAVGRTLEKDFDKAQRQVELIEEMSSVAQSEMRALLLHLRPVYLEGKSLAQGVADLVRELKAKVPMEILLDMDPEIRLVKGIENHLFRIIQEALSNTLRHSKADKMEIRIQQRPEAIKVFLRDNGIGFQIDERKLASYGLSNMKERVLEIGGSVQFITAPGKGTRIEITVPIVNEESGWTENDGDRESD